MINKFITLREKIYRYVSENPGCLQKMGQAALNVNHSEKDENSIRQAIYQMLNNGQLRSDDADRLHAIPGITFRAAREDQPTLASTTKKSIAMSAPAKQLDKPKTSPLVEITKPTVKTCHTSLPESVIVHLQAQVSACDRAIEAYAHTLNDKTLLTLLDNARRAHDLLSDNYV